jgi:hypothetical protein
LPRRCCAFNGSLIFGYARQDESGMPFFFSDLLELAIHDGKRHEVKLNARQFRLLFRGLD